MNPAARPHRASRIATSYRVAGLGAVVLATALSLAACGDDDDDQMDETPSTEMMDETPGTEMMDETPSTAP